jgi:hypothetical protein
MKINELLEAAATPEDEANKIRAELRELFKDAGVTSYEGINVSSERANKSTGTPAGVAIFSVVIPKVENGEYDADEAEITLRLAHRLISKWLDQKEADGHLVITKQYSDVGGGRKFSTRPYRFLTGSKVIDVPGFRVAVIIANKEDPAVVKMKTNTIQGTSSMKINELLEATVTPEDEANEISKEFYALLDDAGVIPDQLEVIPVQDIKSGGKITRTGIYGYVVPKIKNGRYDADEADIALRLAYRLISKWLTQKEADGHLVNVGQHSDVGHGRKFLTRPYYFWSDPKHFVVPSFHLDVSIASKSNTSAVK